MKYYTAIIFLNIFAMGILLVCLKKSNTLPKAKTRIFYYLFTAIIIASLCEWLGNVLQGTGPSTRLLHIVVKATELSVAPAIGFLVADVIEKNPSPVIVLLLTGHVVLEILSGFTGFIYAVNENSVYTHARFYWLYIVAYILSMVYCLWVVARNVKKYQYNGTGLFILILLFMLSGIGLQMYDSSIKVDYITLGMAGILLYVFTLEMINQTDELTQLMNRRGYENTIAHIERKCVVLFFDVDHFKLANDTYGHAFGDRVLKCIGRALLQNYSRYGKCFRYGGDEFCVILNKKTDEVEQLNHDFFLSIEKEREKEQRLPNVSIGYAFYNPDVQSIQEVVREADKMMYAFKERNREKEERK